MVFISWWPLSHVPCWLSRNVIIQAVCQLTTVFVRKKHTRRISRTSDAYAQIWVHHLKKLCFLVICLFIAVMRPQFVSGLGLHWDNVWRGCFCCSAPSVYQLLCWPRSYTKCLTSHCGEFCYLQKSWRGVWSSWITDIHQIINNDHDIWTCFPIYPAVKSIQSISMVTGAYFTTPSVLLEHKFLGWPADMIKLSIAGPRAHSGFGACYHWYPSE